MTPAQPHTSRRDAVITLWYISTDNVPAVLESQPKSDRGFGRKLLAQLNPRWPITVIGQFMLGRSAPASAKEFYIAAYPGVALLQTSLDDLALLSEFDPQLRDCIPAENVYAFVRNPETGLGGFAHWQQGKLRRCFSAKLQRVYEDIGLPEPFEQPFWGGEFAAEAGGIALPFAPLQLVDAAEKAWVGYDPAAGLDIHVAGYAIDGRPEPKLPSRSTDIGWLATQSASKLGLGEQRRDYDDYESHEITPTIGTNVSSVAHRGADQLKALGRYSGRLSRKLAAEGKRGWKNLAEKIRHIDRS